MNVFKHYITSSSEDQFDLLFPNNDIGDKLYKEFNEDKFNLYLRYYSKLRTTYGESEMKEMKSHVGMRSEELYQKIRKINDLGDDE
jgi:hypothetical protein